MKSSPENAFSGEFRTFWDRHFGPLAPLPHVLRTALPDRWFRAHSLPNSVRYAKTPAEMDTVLMRYRTLAAEVLLEGEECWMLCGTTTSPNARGRYHPSLDYSTLSPLGQFSHDGDEWWLFGQAAPWAFQETIALMEQVAEGLEGTLLVASQKTGEVFAPYDGGCDLIVNSPGRAALLWDRYRAWRSSEPSGL
ncbi:DUF3885 domain-containing protein [Paradevosia shaoguanensis]|uniref:DUF3885 domain-containing protein n=2 Tax=Paradevosia shaoguanensis TaxID=1335043 RepID=UPI003CCCF121